MSRSLLPMVLLLFAASTPLATQAKCASAEELALAVASSTNSTGHRRLSARLEQPLRSQEWKLDVRVGAAACGGGCDVPRQWLALTLDGPPSGHLLDSSPAPTPSPAPTTSPAATPSPASTPPPDPTPSTAPTPSPAPTSSPAATHSPAPSPSPAPTSSPAPTPSSASSPSPAPSPSPAATPPPVPPGYLTLPGLGHYRAHPTALTRDDASALCRREGGALVVPTSRHEVDLLFAHFFPFNATGTWNSDFMWHGATDRVEEGKFVTDDGVPLEDIGYAVFESDQPNGGKYENCLTIYKSKALWDTGCNFKLFTICKVFI